MTFVMQFWRGQLGFLGVILVLFVVTFAINIAGAGISNRAVYPVVGVLAVVSIWQIVGAVRFAERVIQDGALARVYGAYGALGLAVVFNLVFAVGLILPQPEMSLEIDGQTPKVAVLGNVAVVTGEIDYRILTELKVAVAKGGVGVVRLQSDGGNVIAGRSIGLFVAREGLTTEVLDHCFSACTLAFIGGARRVLGPDGALGFHGYRVDSSYRVQLMDWKAVVMKDRAFLAAQGVDAAFVDRIFETTPEELWQPDRQILTAAGVLR